MVQTKAYNLEGKENGMVELPAEIFGLKISPDLVHQAVATQLANSRRVLAHTKDRSEVRGGGKKPWKQKGTGRARHGSTRSPIWIGGGVTFGPTKERNFKKKLNKQMKKKALLMVLSGKVGDNQLFLVDDLKINQPKTKEMIKLIDGLISESKRSVLVVLPSSDAVASSMILRAGKNIKGVKLIKADSLNVIDLLSYKYLIMAKEAIETIKKVYVKVIQK